jgi:peptidoglycan/LPS O-acetylase OafA/YrhL
VFFVISGFVITSVLLREREKTGRISFRDFYMRRVKRILPASLLVLIVTVVVSYFVFLSGRANSVLVDGVWTLFFSANWRFATDGTDYWAQDTPASPLQHYWSLGVEEQFYFVWPALLVLVLWISTRLGADVGRGRTALLVLLVIVSLASFAWAIHETVTNPTWAYFSTISRAWEMGVGAALAVGAGMLARIPKSVRTPLAWLGVAGIAGSFLLVTEDSAFPAPWAALPVLATAFVIAAGTGGHAIGLGILTNKALGYVGDVSFSLYLWHFPVIILLDAVTPDRDLAYYLSALALMIALTILSYEFWEQRFRIGPKPNKKKSTNANVGLSPRSTYAGLTALALLASVLAGAALAPDRDLEAAARADAANPLPTSSPMEPAEITNQSLLTDQLETALSATEWPELVPSLDNVAAEGMPDEDGEGCSRADLETPSCSWDTGNAETVVVLGDSTGVTLLPTIRAALGDQYNVRGMTMAGCVSIDVEVKDDRPDLIADCAEFKKDAVSKINEMKPAMVFISNTSHVIGQLVSAENQAQSITEWRVGTENLLKSLAPSGAQLIIVTAPPRGTALQNCATRTSSPADCEYLLPSSFEDAAVAMQAAAAGAGAALIDTRSWFCVQNACPAFAGTTPVKRDGVHTTKQYAAALVPVFTDALAEATVTR